MGRRNTRKSASEFPFLAELGLKITSIRGDGNCLFRAFSDQLYGDQSRSCEIRAKIVEYMKDHPDDFKPFVNVVPGGGTRRNPKRKNTAAPALDAFGPTPAQIDQAWEQYLVRMARDAEYGDNLEIRAFAAAYQVDVRIYRLPKMAYFILCGEDFVEGETRQIVHIALNAEHYSSIRNLTGPDTGLPHVKPTDLKALTASQAAAAVPTKTLKIEQWMVNSVSSSLPNFVDEATITKTLLLNKGNVDSTVSQLLLEDNSTPPSSGPSSPDSSFSAQSGNYSIVRDEESEDEDKIYGPTRRKARKEKEEAEKAEKEKEKEKLIYQDETEVKQRCEKELAAIPLSMWNLTTLMI